MPGPNFVEPGFANITPCKEKSVEGVLHEITDLELKRIIASEGENYELVDIKVPFFNNVVTAKTLIYKTDIIHAKMGKAPLTKRQTAKNTKH